MSFITDNADGISVILVAIGTLVALGFTALMIFLISSGKKK